MPQEGEGEEWLSIAVQKLWPYLSLAVESSVMDSVPAILQASKPSWMEAILLDRSDKGGRGGGQQAIVLDGSAWDTVVYITSYIMST